MEGLYELDGEKVDLVTLCSREPGWAASRIEAHHQAFKAILHLLEMKGTAPDCIRAICKDNIPEWEQE